MVRSIQRDIDGIWQTARSGELKPAAEAVGRLLNFGPTIEPAAHTELHLVIAFCAIRQGHYDEALHALTGADRIAATSADPRPSLRVQCWFAELAYCQGRYAAALETIERTLHALIEAHDLAYAAFAQRTRIAVLLARADYEAIDELAGQALTDAETSGDDYVLVQVLNLLGAVQFDRATAKLPGGHARAHLSSLDSRGAAPLESDARKALALFERARSVAQRGDFEFAAWYIAGNIERLQILLGHAGRVIGAMRKRLKAMQKRGARYDEIVTRSNLAWALRTLERHREALHELDVALDLARDTGTFNVLLEFIHYDRALVLDALGDRPAALASYRRYARMVRARNGNATNAAEALRAGVARRPLEPVFLRRADSFIAAHLEKPMQIARLAQHCGVSWRSLQQAFADFRGVTPVAHVRNMRLDAARLALDGGRRNVADVATSLGFGSSTTFALEYRKRFGAVPSRARRKGQG